MSEKRSIRRHTRIALLTSTSLFFGVSLPVEIASAATFADMRGHYAAPAVNRLASQKLISSDTGKFLPATPMTRQTFAVLLAKVIGLMPRAKVETSFIDVPNESAYAPYLKAVTDAGLLKGKDEYYFGAYEELTRQDLAVILARVMDKVGLTDATLQAKTKTPTFTDSGKIAPYAKDAVYTVAAQGWMIGNKGLFSPTKTVSRAEAAVIADRLVERRIKQAEQSTFQVATPKLHILAGTSQKIEVKPPEGQERVPFTPVFAFDNREQGMILPDGTFIAGPKVGNGQITVSVGYRTVEIPVEITPDGQTSDNKDTKGQESSQPAPPEQPKSDTPTRVPATAPPQTSTSSDLNRGFVNYAPKGYFAVKSTDPADIAFEQAEKKFPGPVGGLVVPSTTWTGYHRQAGREVTLTLAQMATLHHVTLTFRQEKKLGITIPPYMEVEVSRDGQAWFHGGKVTHNVPPGEEVGLERTLTVSLPPIDAKYIRIRFPVKVWAFARQLEVYGFPTLQTDVNTVMLAPAKQNGVQAQTKPDIKVKNLLLAYTGAHGDRGEFTSQDFLPLVGYVTPEGKVLDQMFDGILFLPYPNQPTTKEGWERYLDNIFASGRQLDALNDAMQEYNKRRGTLVISPTVESVILTLPYPNATQATFGQIDPDRDSFNFTSKGVGEEQAYQYRLEAMQWYLARLMERWNNGAYNYLRLDGIYWYHELVDDAAPKERELILSAARMVHDQGLLFYWIPYYGSPGLSEWKELGFDYAFIQPNFYSDKEIPVNRIETTLAVANKYGMGIEVEGDERMMRDLRYYRLYYNQLIAGHKLGIDKQKRHAYYYGSKSLLQAFYSKESQARAIYDDTYKWLSGKFTLKEYLTTTVTPAPVVGSKPAVP